MRLSTPVSSVLRAPLGGESVTFVRYAETSPYAMPYERRAPICVCRGLKMPLAEASRKEKNRRIKEHRTNITWSARIVEGYYQLAGETELAERLRPIVTRSSRPSTPPPADESPVPVPDEPTPPTGTPDDSAPDEPIADEPTPEEDTAEDSALRALRTLANIHPAPSTPDA